MTREEFEMRTLVRESDVIDRTDGSELAKAFNYLWEKYVEQEPCDDCISRKDAIACCRNEWEEEVADRIEALPSVQPKSSFINKPCISEGVCHDIAVQKLQTIQSNTPSTTDWEHYADKLYDVAYRRGYEKLKDEMDEMLHVMLESDPRTFSNPVSDNGLYYDAIADVLKKLWEFHSGTDNS